MGYPFINPITWALAISLATFAAVWTFVSYKSRAWRSTVRGLALVVLPFGLLFTGSLTMLLRVLDAIALWASALVFSPMVWVGTALVVASLGVFVAAGRLPGGRDKGDAKPAALRRSGAEPAAADDSAGDFDDIEAILRRRGIT